MAQKGGGAYPRADVAGRTRDVFFITMDSTLGVSGSDTQRFTIDTDADVLLTHLTYDVRDGAATATIITDPNISVIITLSSSGRQLMNAGTPLTNLGGNGRQVSKWAAPKFLDAGTTFSVALTNNVAAAMRAKLTFHGFKLFR